MSQRMRLSEASEEGARNHLAETQKSPAPQRRSYKDSPCFVADNVEPEDSATVAAVTAAPQKPEIKMGPNARGIAMQTIGTRQHYRRPK